uniref:Uncharacterized protein n=1 Tax=Nelumbo nucifera TaxID=4432 RepID=A0A822ZUK9_NELNU|nr:TPA_asm: hypothetical protein HUJ06_018167 [Nelumbo nucifera]
MYEILLLCCVYAFLWRERQRQTETERTKDAFMTMEKSRCGSDDDNDHQCFWSREPNCLNGPLDVSPS